MAVVPGLEGPPLAYLVGGAVGASARGAGVSPPGRVSLAAAARRSEPPIGGMRCETGVGGGHRILTAVGAPGAG